MQHEPIQLSFNAPFQQQSSVDGGPITMRQYACSPGSLKVNGLNRHLLLINTGEPLSITSLNDQQIKSTAIADKDSVIGVLPAGTTGELKWFQTLHLRVLMLDSDYTQRLMGPIDLRQRWNIGNGSLGEALKRLNKAMSVPHLPERTYVESLIILCLDLILRHQNSISSDHPGKGKLSPTQLQHVITFAHDSMQLDIGLVDLANLVHLSAYHFGRLFKQTIGLSPYQYILQLRIEFAKKLILEKAGPLGEIAYQLNFSDQAHFSNAFRKATGFSPRQFQHHQPAII